MGKSATPSLHVCGVYRWREKTAKCDVAILDYRDGRRQVTYNGTVQKEEEKKRRKGRDLI
jgi:hypothetical protein